MIRMSGHDDVWESTARRRPGIARNFSSVIGFINAALTGSLAEASRQLGVSSPSLSKSIARLESPVECTLAGASWRAVFASRGSWSAPRWPVLRNTARRLPSTICCGTG
ncbi:LysR family transcriptional regulator [Paraburkholderia guartelaensis]|uniref:helix-turn-helix domain-containing protein n=1 Tax=Paraburkholderia guartelaensis TaxID=2546446 RepID=UPI00387937F6